MASPEKKPFSPVTLLIDTVLCVLFFLYMYGVVKTHVPSSDPRMIVLWGALTSSCLTGVFWLAWQMLKTVFRFQASQRQRR